MSAAPEVEGGRRRIFLATPGFEAALIAELQALAGPLAPPPAGLLSEQLPGVVSTGEPLAPHGPHAAAAAPLDAVFARQQLPNAIAVRASSVAALAEAAYREVEAVIDTLSAPFMPSRRPAPSPAWPAAPV